MKDDPRDWIALTSLPGIGAASINKLWLAGWSPHKIIKQLPAMAAGVRFTVENLKLLEQFSSGSGLLYERVECCLSWLSQHEDGRIILLSDPEYPPLLRQIYDPPAVLFVRGSSEILSQVQIALVGSRHATKSGARQAYGFASELSRQGFVITSGLAQGIDGSAHQAAVDQNKPTVAVFGTGINRVYPNRNNTLAQDILKTGGCWLTEFLPGTGPRPANFPKRNRIISGLSLGVIVVEAALKSGSLITARLALEHNRDVFALPGSINNPQSKGCHQLIRDGALLVDTPQQIVESLDLFTSTAIETYNAGAELDAELCDEERVILDYLSYDSLTLDQLVAETGFAISTLSTRLVELELKGLVEQSLLGYSRVNT